MNNEKRMTFWEHVYEIRNRLLVVMAFTVVFAAGSYLFFPYLFSLVHDVLGEELYATDITEGFVTRLRVSVLTGFFLSIPLLLFQIVLFIFPALKKKEKAVMLSLLLTTFILFLAGLAFAWKTVLPVSVRFLKSRAFFPENVSRLISYRTFISFFFQFLIGFGLCFQFPIALLFLLKAGFLSITGLVKGFKYVIAGIFLVAAIITPPDVVSQILLAVPMILLYLASILTAKLLGWGKS